MLENTVQIARGSYEAENERVAAETVTMRGDLAQYLRLVSRDDPRFAEGFARQVLIRNLSEAIIVNVGSDGGDDDTFLSRHLFLWLVPKGD